MTPLGVTQHSVGEGTQRQPQSAVVDATQEGGHRLSLPHPADVGAAAHERGRLSLDHGGADAAPQHALKHGAADQAPPDKQCRGGGRKVRI